MKMEGLLIGTPTRIPLNEDTRVHLHLPYFVLERSAGIHTMRAQLSLDETLDQLEEYPHLECIGRAYREMWWTEHRHFGYGGHEVKPS